MHFYAASFIFFYNIISCTHCFCFVFLNFSSKDSFYIMFFFYLWRLFKYGQERTCIYCYIVYFFFCKVPYYKFHIHVGTCIILFFNINIFLICFPQKQIYWLIIYMFFVNVVCVFNPRAIFIIIKKKNCLKEKKTTIHQY